MQIIIQEQNIWGSEMGLYELLILLFFSTYSVFLFWYFLHHICFFIALKHLSFLLLLLFLLWAATLACQLPTFLSFHVLPHFAHNAMKNGLMISVRFGETFGEKQN